MATKYRRWAETSRAPQTQEAECALCQEKTLCFTFQDNEAYGQECLCRECLAEAMRLLEAKKETDKPWPGVTDEHLTGDLKRGELPEP